MKHVAPDHPGFNRSLRHRPGRNARVKAFRDENTIADALGKYLVTCPCCGGTGEIEPAAPVPLSPMEFRVWDAVRKSRDGLAAPAIAEKIYADRYDGGPLHAKTCVYLTIRSANRRLKAAGVEIASSTHHRGAVYKIRPIGGGTR